MAPDGRSRAAGWTAGVVASVAAAGLLWASVSAHGERACTLLDTPYLPLCEEPSDDLGAIRHELRERVRENPGDSTAWAALLASGEPSHPEGVLRGAAMVAPNNGTVLQWRAAKALEAGKIPEAVALLVQMVETRGSPEAVRILAQVTVAENGIELLRPHLQASSRWLPSVLATLPSLKIPPGQALPLVAEAMGRGALPDAARQAYMRSLKASGQWLDAYGLWLAHQKQVVPLLYNSGFDQAFEQDGFDWEFSPVPRSKAGFILEQQAVARRGLVLLVDFTGRSFAVPIVRQYVFAQPGTYRLRGEYMGAKLRTEGGLAWNVRCTSGGKALAGKSAALQDTGGVWKAVDVEFTVPADCGAVASLQLEPAAAFEATTGMRGTVAFDNFSLTRTAH
jgi:hypothetical protein